MEIKIHSVLYNRSLVDGPGVRTVVFLQGCDVRCEGCHNASAWDPEGGIRMRTEVLADLLKKNCRNRKVTLSGGEPLLQADAVSDLIGRLHGFDIALYTGHAREDVPERILQGIRYLKTGPYVKEKRTTVLPYVGSANQVFSEVCHGEKQ